MALSAAEIVLAIKARDEASAALDSVKKKAGGLGAALSGVSEIAPGRPTMPLPKAERQPATHGAVRYTGPP